MSDSTQLAKNLRQNSTDAEPMLWARLRAHRFCGLIFRRQPPIGRYIVDFVCFEKNLIIQLDGSRHARQSATDAKRDAFLAASGFPVVRIGNNERMSNLEGALQTIEHECGGC